MNFPRARGTNGWIRRATPRPDAVFETSVPRFSPASLIALFACLCGCEDLREFQTRGSEVYRGEVIGSDAAADVESFIRKGFASHTVLELSFDPSSTDVVAQGDGGPRAPDRTAAGSINTYVCPQGAGQCDENERTSGPFVHAPLITMDALTHDPLSQYTFPGGGRLRNYIFGVRFVSENAEHRTGRDAMAFISLMENHQVELRVMAPAVLDQDGEGERWPALFGVFSLQRAAR